jgi:transposase
LVLAFCARVEKTVVMRGTPDPQLAMLTTLSTEELIPADHPIRRIRVVVDAVLAQLDETFDGMYAAAGRVSVPPETLLKATVLTALYSIRSERAFCERLNYDLLFKWFLDMRIDQPAFDASTFSRNRRRLLDAAVADEFFAAVVRQAGFIAPHVPDVSFARATNRTSPRCPAASRSASARKCA